MVSDWIKNYFKQKSTATTKKDDTTRMNGVYF